MKRLISLTVALTIALLLCFSASANTPTNNSVTIEDYTIIFDEDCTLTQEEMLHLAQLRANYVPESDNGTSTYGVICNMFGHKTTTETIVVVEHCVRDTQPRCYESLEDLTVCSRCDYVNVEVLSTAYIFCCD